MNEDYIKMWEDLNLNIDGHNNLLNTLGEFYKMIYLSQENRADMAKYLDFLVSEAHGLRIKELQDAKKQGRKIVGTFCVFVPEEFVWALNSICVGLCAGAEIGKEAAETVLPRNTCALIKSFVGFKLARLCPYFESCDLVVGETTCDGKKKVYEIMSEMTNLHIMEVPHMKEATDRELFKSEIYRFKDVLENLTGNKLTEENLSRAIKMMNGKRKVLQRLNNLRKSVPTVISGRDALLAHQLSFYDDPERFTEKMNMLCDELEERIEKKAGISNEKQVRIMLSGCPMAVPNWKVPFIIETSKAVVVGEESCIGTRSTRDLVSEKGKTVDEMINNIVDRYMKIDCACFTPNKERIDNIIGMAKDLDVDGVIHYSLSFCSPYTIEAFKIEKALEKENIPLLKIESDYSMEDMEILKNRIEAFIGMIK